MSLLSIDGIRQDRMPHGKYFDRWRKNLSDAHFETIFEALQQVMDGYAPRKACLCFKLDSWVRLDEYTISANLQGLLAGLGGCPTLLRIIGLACCPTSYRELVLHPAGKQ